MKEIRRKAAHQARWTVNDIVRKGFATRTARGVHWVLGIVAFLVLASYTGAHNPPMRTDAFAKAEVMLLAADVMLCLGIYLVTAWAELRKERRRA
jgi:hypothetical protein